MPLKFCPIASGSSGNCIFLGDGETNILIDAGVSGVKIAEGLRKINISPSDINAIFVTHEHSDHIKGAGIFSRRFKKPIYATMGTWNGMSDFIGKVSDSYVKYVEKNCPITLGRLTISAFEIPHDAASPVGYYICADDTKVTVATDIGCITQEVKSALSGSDIILLEANHDVDMLKRGSYPYVLKRRILSDAGHLSNESAAILLSEVISEKLKYIYLGHLSSENNLPQLAFDTVYNHLKALGCINGRFKMRTALRHDVSVLTEV